MDAKEAWEILTYYIDGQDDLSDEECEAVDVLGAHFIKDNSGDYPINHHILAEDFRDKREYTQDDAQWLLDSLRKMCNAYDDLIDKE